MLIKKSILSMRSYEAGNSSIKNPKYKKLLRRSDVIEAKIKALIPEEKKDEYLRLSNELFNAEVKVNRCEQKAIYKQGFYDGLEIAIRLLKHKVNK